MDSWPTPLRVARKGDECHVLWPGELAGPFKRSGYEIQEYVPEGDGDGLRERYEQFVEAARMIRGSLGPQSSKVAFGALYAALDAHEAERLATTPKPQDEEER